MKATLTKQYSRKISTAQYESLDVISGIEVEVEYRTAAELETASKELAKTAIKQLETDILAAKEILGVQEKRGFTKTAETKTAPASIKVNQFDDLGI